MRSPKLRAPIALSQSGSWSGSSSTNSTSKQREICSMIARRRRRAAPGTCAGPRAGGGDTADERPVRRGTPLAWQQAFDQGGWDFAAGVVCEPWGKCTWIGTTEKTTNPHSSPANATHRDHMTRCRSMHRRGNRSTGGHCWRALCHATYSGFPTFAPKIVRRSTPFSTRKRSLEGKIRSMQQR